MPIPDTVGTPPRISPIHSTRRVDCRDLYVVSMTVFVSGNGPACAVALLELSEPSTDAGLFISATGALALRRLGVRDATVPVSVAGETLSLAVAASATAKPGRGFPSTREGFGTSTFGR